MHTPHGGWWDSHLVQGRLGAFWRLWPQSVGKATGPRTQDCGEQLAGCLRGKQWLPRPDWHGRDGDRNNIRWPDLASSACPGSRRPAGRTEALGTQYRVLSPHQIHSEVNLDMASLPHSEGVAWVWGSWGAPPAAPSACLSRLPWEVASVSDFRLYCYFLKKTHTHNSFLNVFLAAT